MNFICPKCKEEFHKQGNSLICLNGHCFDFAKSGYVNLLINNKGGNHGDNKLMTKARSEFLKKGYYEPLRDELVLAACKYAKGGDTLLDCGCGEGYYTSAVYEGVDSVSMLGFDISKDELNIAAKRNKCISYAVASSFSIPVKDNSIDILFEVFSPFCESEFKRVLKKNGIMIMAIPLKNHLFGLKKAVYDNPYKNEVADFNIDGFEFVENRELKYTISIDNNRDIANLFTMTPYYYKTGKAEQARFNTLQQLETEVEFSVLIYKKI